MARMAWQGAIDSNGLVLKNHSFTMFNIRKSTQHQVNLSFSWPNGRLDRIGCGLVR